MPFSQKHIADLFFSCKMDLQRTEGLLGADRSRRKVHTDDSAKEKDSTEGSEPNVISPQQSSLHYQREVVAMFSTVSTRMESEALQAAKSLHSSSASCSKNEASAAFVLQSFASVSSTAIEHQRRVQPLTDDSEEAIAAAVAKAKKGYRFTKGLLKALDMTVEPPKGVVVVNTTGENYDDGFSAVNSNGVPEASTVRQVVLKRVMDVSHLWAADPSSATTGEAEDMATASSSLSIVDNKESQASGPSLTDKLRFLPPGELSTIVAKLWARVFSRMLRGALFTDFYSLIVSVASTLGFGAPTSTSTTIKSSDASEQVNDITRADEKVVLHRSRQKLVFAQIAHAILSSETCANQLRAISDSLFTVRTHPKKKTSSPTALSAIALPKTYHPNVFYGCVESGYLSLLAETTQLLILQGKYAIQCGPSVAPIPTALTSAFLPPPSWAAAWYYHLFTIMSIPRGLLSLMLLGNDPKETASGGGIGKSLAGLRSPTSSSASAAMTAEAQQVGALERYRSAVLKPLVLAAREVFTAVLFNEVPHQGPRASSFARVGAVGSGEGGHDTEGDEDADTEERRTQRLITVASAAFVAALSRVLSAHYQHTGGSTSTFELLESILFNHAEDSDDDNSGTALEMKRTKIIAEIFHFPDTILRQELVLPIINALKTATEEHKARVKSFGLTRSVIEKILSKAPTNTATNSTDTAAVQLPSEGVKVYDLSSALPSRLLIERVYSPLKRQLALFLTAAVPTVTVPFTAFHRETSLTLLYQLLTSTTSAADDEEEAVASSTRAAAHLRLGTSHDAYDTATMKAHKEGGVRRLIAASAEDVRHAIKKCFERRTHLVDRSGYEGTGGSAGAGGVEGGELDQISGGAAPIGVIYKWNTDVFTAVVGELGLPLQPQGRRPLEEGGHELFRLTVPTVATRRSLSSGAASSPPQRVYYVYIERGLLHARELLQNDGHHGTVQGEGNVKSKGVGVRSLLLGGRPKPSLHLSAGKNKKPTADALNDSFKVVEAFESFFGGEALSTTIE